ncbi:MAG: amino acid ABC transporter permease [Promethearchaeota archaeon]
MLFQTESEFTNLVIGITLGIVIQIVLFIMGSYITRWYAKKKSKHYTEEWDVSLKTAMFVNVIWLIINIPVSIIIKLLVFENIFIDLINVGLNIATGTITVKLIYKKKIGESFFFVVIIQIVYLIASLIFGFIIAVLLGFIIKEYYEIVFYILRIGIFSTLLLTILGLSIGFLIGLLLALMRIYAGVELGWLSSGYEKLFRGIPILVLIYIFTFGLSDLFWFLDPTQRPFASVVLALALRSGAYQSQIFRGAILSVNPGQIDAARALGMNGRQAFRHIIFPQALRLAIPSWSNEYAVVIKDTSFAYAVGIIEMTKAAYDYSRAFRGTWAISIGILAIIYFLLTFPITKLFGERQTKKLKELGMGGG